MRNKAMHIVFIALVVFVSGVSADERDGLRFIVKRNPVPGAVNNSPTPPADDLLSTQTSELKLAGAALLRFYQVFISTQDVPSCPFEPTCSEYAKQAVYTYGLLAGSIMAVDRYQRCNGLDLGIYPRDPVTGRFIDPP